jgi:DNA-binding XRE family transcriptional regulator
LGILSRGAISIKNSLWDMAKPSPSHAGCSVLVALGKTIRQIRLKKGFSQESVALASDLDRSYFGGIERGEHNVAVINLQKIAKALDVSIKDLFNK